MKSSYVAAVVQINSGEDKAANLAKATRFIEQAVQQHADLIVLPEMFNCLGKFDVIVEQAETIPGPTSQLMSSLAARFGVHLLAGSMAEKDPASGKAFNTSLLFGPDGALLKQYRKIHLFDVNLSEAQTFEESRWIVPGQDVSTVKTPLGMLGQSTCYDLRFPELFRAQSNAGTDVFLIPSAFTKTTGTDHWSVLLRARAIENQAYVIAPNQCGRHSETFETYGHSSIIDPWGKPLAELADEEGIAIATIDFNALRDVRKRLPALNHRVLS